MWLQVNRWQISLRENRHDVSVIAVSNPLNWLAGAEFPEFILLARPKYHCFLLNQHLSGSLALKL